MGHLSLLEHANVTFYITGISRSCTHELIRHRHFSYSQLSQRFVPEHDSNVVAPPAIVGDPELEAMFTAATDASRAAYTELLADERKDTAGGFWQRASAFFAGHGITVQRVMTDNGSCYRSKVFNEALGENVKHKYTRPYRPQTNGKIERFHRTLADEWAYARHYDSDQQRAASYDAWLHHYNHHRPHTGIGGRAPIDRVHNVNGKNT